MKKEARFVIFEGDENEIEFLEKCKKQWEITANSEISDMMKIIQIATVFHEIDHRIREMKEGKRTRKETNEEPIKIGNIYRNTVTGEQGIVIGKKYIYLFQNQTATITCEQALFQPDGKFIAGREYVSEPKLVDNNNLELVKDRQGD